MFLHSGKVLTLSLLLILLLNVDILAQENTEGLDSQLKSRLQTENFRLGLLVQTNFRYSFEDDNFQGGRTFQLANARVDLRGNLDGGFFYRVFVNMSSEPNLLDAFVGYRYDARLRIIAGAQKPQQTTDFIPPPQSTDFMSRARITGLLVQRREIGLSAQGDIENFYYYAGIFNGSGLSANNNNKLYAIGRLQYTTREVIPGFIRFAISGSHGNSAGINSGANGPLLRGTRSIVGADIHVETDKIKIKAEYLTGELETVRSPLATETISGYYVSGGYKIDPKWMFVSRFQGWHFDLNDESHTQITLGAKYQATSLISFRFNIDVYSPENGDSQAGAGVMMQFSF